MLFKVSGEICDRIRDDRLRLSQESVIQMEKLKASLTDKDMFDIDSKISDITEKKKGDILAKHEKKLQYLKSSRQSYPNINNELVFTTAKKDKQMHC